MAMSAQEMTSTIDTERPARRTRPRGLSTLHQEQIEDSQQRILAAAALAFTRNSYNATPVDTIISIAGVSRATFYKYFTSKFDVAKGLIEAFMPRLTAVFDALPDRPSPEEAQAWLQKLLQLYEDNRQATTLFGEVGGSEPGFFPQMIAFHDGLLAHLGQRIPAFAKAASGLPEHAGVHVVAHLCIQHLFGFCTNVVSKGWDIDIDAGARYLAAELCRFIAENAD
jgi:AcrR family transcriptional regulator